MSTSCLYSFACADQGLYFCKHIFCHRLYKFVNFAYSFAWIILVVPFYCFVLDQGNTHVFQEVIVCIKGYLSDCIVGSSMFPYFSAIFWTIHRMLLLRMCQTSYIYRKTTAKNHICCKETFHPTLLGRYSFPLNLKSLKALWENRHENQQSQKLVILHMRCFRV